MQIPAHQLRITMQKDPCAGGQTVGSFPRGITIEHIPTQLSATCNQERSQFRNKQVAMEMIEYGLMAMRVEQEHLDRLTPEVMAELRMIQ